MRKFDEEDWGIDIGGDGKQKPRRQSEPTKSTPPAKKK